MLFDEDNELYGAFQANGTPSAVLIGGDGAIVSYVASGRDAIEDLLHQVLDAPGIPVGGLVPSRALESLDGATIELAADSGSGSLLVFWNPDCGHCRAMHEDLLEWEAGVNGIGSRLVIVSSGDAERTREDGFPHHVRDRECVHLLAEQRHGDRPAGADPLGGAVGEPRRQQRSVRSGRAGAGRRDDERSGQPVPREPIQVDDHAHRRERRGLDVRHRGGAGVQSVRALSAVGGADRGRRLPRILG